MANKFKLKINPMQFLNAELKRKLKNLDFIDVQTTEKIAEVVKDQIVERTLQGEGAEDNKTIKFRAYAPSYKKVRSKHGLSTSPVDLFFTGHMLTQLKIGDLEKGGKFSIRVHPDDKGKWRGAHEGVESKKGLKRRPFLDLSQKDKTAIKDDINKIIKKEAQKKLKDFGKKK